MRVKLNTYADRLTSFGIHVEDAVECSQPPLASKAVRPSFRLLPARFAYQPLSSSGTCHFGFCHLGIGAVGEPGGATATNLPASCLGDKTTSCVRADDDKAHARAVPREESRAVAKVAHGWVGA